MRPWIVTLLVCLHCIEAIAARSGSLLDPPPELVGTWSWTLPDGNCTETVTYRADGSRAVISGKEELTGRYSVHRTEDPRFLRLSVTTLTDNGGEDCGGDSGNDSGKSFVIYVAPVRGGQLVFCFKPDFDECLGPYRRRAPAGPAPLGR